MPDPPLRILLIEDNPGDARLIQLMLREAGESDGSESLPASVEVADRLSTGLERLANASFDVALVDLGLPDAEGLAVVMSVRDHAPDLPIVVLSGREDRTTALEAVHEGAQDYLLKGHVEPDLLQRALRYAVERGRLLRREREARSAAEAAVRTRDQVLSTVTHDLRTPLAAIRLYAQTLPERASTADPRLKRLLDEQAQKIGQAAKDGLVMIEELLDVARLTMGEALQLNRGTLDVVSLVLDAVAQHRESAAQHRLVFQGPDQPIMGSWDGPRLRRVIDNLLSNATKYSAPGTEVRVVVAEEQDAERPWVLMTISDQGVGISGDDLPHLFEWFWRGKNVKGRRGSGLGLAGVRRIAELHGGAIAVESLEGVGSTFSLRLPLN